MRSSRHSPRSSLPRHPVWRDHARWIGYALAAISVWVFMSAVLFPSWSAETGDSDSLLLMLAIPLFFLFLVWKAVSWLWRCTWQHWRAYRFAHGHPTRREAQILAIIRDHETAVEHARTVARDLATTQSFDLGPAWDVNLDRDERILFNGQAHYSRFYGQEVTYWQSSTFFFGSPLFVAAGLGATALGNRSRRNAALRQAAAQWREGQMTRCLVTDHRILIHHLDGRWLSFWFSGAVGVYPALNEDTLILEFNDTSPLRLQGPASLIASVGAIWTAHGVQGLLQHPALDPLRSSTGIIAEA
ncbi:hypothetical protein [Actinomyces ruminicola]|uniref:Uncharacterized protein n=1 Tax=Actinomyces ruminicola TaxID=332524 RepID=A0A1G9TLY2_9ACTO|nr:hypothetical protein [Actinomyces ruminicola]SDM48766.1 hypothetical protein SAMN04487766_10354 [Actinomyces ruminicola]